MKHLHAPWRSDFTRAELQGKKPDATQKECIFCMQFAENNDDKYFIIRRFAYCAIMLNKYPYNAGHLLILPLNHTGTLEDLNPLERVELIELATASTVTLRKLSPKAEGFNIGVNLGKAAGASIPSHLHMHVLPRWIGDTNFMPALAETKIISSDLSSMYGILKKEFDAL